jgi:hypothetical protein
MASKVLLVYGWVEPGYLGDRLPSPQLVEAFLAPERWPWWQFALLGDALLTILLLLFADAALARVGSKGTWSEATVSTVVSTAAFSRGILALASVAHGFYAALRFGVIAPGA